MESNNEVNNQNIDVIPRKVEVIYRRKTRERKLFMDELKEIRKQRHKRFMKKIINAIGPNWYYELSEPQRSALDTLEFSIYQDVLEGRPKRCDQVIRLLGVYPRLCTDDLMHCVITGRKDPKQLLANVFGLIFGHAIDGKRAVYDFNGKLLLSAILHLGLNHLLQSLQTIFYMEQEVPKEPKPEIKPKPILKSPYLQEMVACLYQPPKRKSQKPPPLPNLDSFNEPYEPEPLIRKPPPLPPPPPPPKKKIPRSYCDKLAGIIPLVPRSSIDNISMKPMGRSSYRRGRRTSKISILEDKKAGFGIGCTVNKKPRRKKPVAPSTGLHNAQYMILGVSIFNNKCVYNLGSISILPPDGYLIHGGYAHISGGYININCGIRAYSPPPAPDPCDCVAKWYDSVFQYIKDTKCYCSHFYDYGNEGAFLPEELPFFEKPTKHGPFRFNYQTIYDLDEKQICVEKEFKRIWDTESILGAPPRDKKDKKKKGTLGDNLKPEEYLRAALRMLRRDNVAARLPDVHLVPVLKEWMRYRMYGPYTSKDKMRFLNQSANYWQKFWSLEVKDYVHVYPPRDPKYAGTTNWVHKQELVDNFRKYTQKYKMEVFKTIANFNNMMWPSMCQAQFPDKKFREIYFSYLAARVEDIILMHPYSVKETAERKRLLRNKRYSCFKPVERDEPAN